MSQVQKKFLAVPGEKRKERNIKNFFKKTIDEIKLNENNYIEISTTEKSMPDYGIQENITRFIFKNPKKENRKESSENFKKIIENLIKKAMMKKRIGWDVKRISIDLFCELLNDPIILPARDPKMNNADTVLHEIFRINQSYSEFDLQHEPISCIITTYSTPRGAGFNPLDFCEIKELGRISVKNSDNYCLFYALTLSRFYQLINKNDEEAISRDQFKKIIANEQRQWEAVKQLMTDAKINMKEKSYGLEHLQIIQDFWDSKFPGNFRIVAFSRDVGLRPIFKGNGPRKYNVCIFHDKNHWDGIKSIGQFFNIKHKYCISCETTYQIEEKHSLECEERCKKCCRIGFGFPCPPERKTFNCEKCNRAFFNENCFEHHKNKICSLYQKCKKCKGEFRTDTEHNCDQKHCRKCHLIHDPKKLCFMQKLKIKKMAPYRIVAYDLECTTNTILDENSLKKETIHKPNFISARFTCSLCLGEIKECEICGDGPRHLKWCSMDRIDPLNCFVKWIINFQKYDTYAYAHFGGRYDSHFILRELANLGYKQPELTIADLKIYEIKFKKGEKSPKFFFRDSWLLMQNKLAHLPKTFGLDCESKLYFPHQFNKEENYGKILTTLPPFDDYFPDEMSEDEYDKFKKWYYDNYNSGFVLEEKLEEYCSNDTDILMKALIKLRRIFIDITIDKETPNGIDVMRLSTTIASSCMNIFRAKFLKNSETLPIIPESGFEPKDSQSNIAIKYFEWIMHRDGVKARHAGNGGEISIFGDKKLKIDCIIGAQKRIIEFQGCAFHGCRKCYKGYMVQANGFTAEQNYDKTQRKMEKLRIAGKKMGYSVEEVWECDVRKMLNKKSEFYDAEMAKYFNNLPEIGPIIPRKGFAGGRTGPLCLFAEASENTEISIFDIVSLYPWVNYSTPYPIGIPKIIIPKQYIVKWTIPDNIPYEGLLKVRVIPPKKHLLPVLPFHTDGLLLFTNCASCAKKGKSDFVYAKNIKKCRHSAEQRALTGEFCTLELKKALEQGAVIDRFYRGYHYENFDGNLFKEYVRKFLKLKVEASGWPQDVKTKEEKMEFVKTYRETYKIELDTKNMNFNPGLRHIAKLALNSLWGKFSMRNKLCSTKMISKPSEFFELINDYTIDMAKPIRFNDNTLRVIFCKKDEYIKEHKCSNVMISIWTTAQARLKLYSYMEQINNSENCKLIYTDTDSVFFMHPKGTCPIKEGSFLGEMSKEYADSEILEVVCAGPKQYALKLKNKNGEIWYKTKIRGMTQNKNNKIDYEEFKDMVLNYEEEKKIQFKHPNKFGPTRESYVISRNITKNYRPIQKKGIILNDENLSVLPFGCW